MAQYNIHAAKTHFSSLLDLVANGEEVVIAKAGKPVAKIVSIEEAKPKAINRIGFMEGMFTLPDNFEQLDRAADKEIEALFLDGKAGDKADELSA